MAPTVAPSTGRCFDAFGHSTGRRRSRPRPSCVACSSSRGSSARSRCSTRRPPGALLEMMVQCVRDAENR